MAKASQRDLDAALELYQFLEALRYGRSAADAVEEFGYAGYDDLVERQAPEVDYLLRAHERCSLMRVVFGMQVLLDPRNEMIDPDLDHLAHHPKRENLRAENAAARELVAAAGRMEEACSANLTGKDVNALPHGNLVGFPIERRDDAKKFCAVLNELSAALAKAKEAGLAPAAAPAAAPAPQPNTEDDGA